MKKLIHTTILFLWAFPLISFAQNIEGMYEREKDFMDNPSVLILKAGGRFEISTGGTSARGSYAIENGTVRFIDETGDYADTMAGAGVYTMEVNGSKLLFKAVKDKAIQRKHVLTACNWRRMRD
jgi:predicted secreted protein